MVDNDLPLGWKKVQLGDICETTSGGTPDRRKFSYYNGSIAWVKSGELNHNTIVKTEETITQEGLENSSAKIFPKGTLLIALYGSTVGKLAWLGIDAATNQAVCGIILPNEIVPQYIYYFLFSYKDELMQQRVGGAQPNISQGIINSVLLPLPPFVEQQRIVEKLDTLLSKLDSAIADLKYAQVQIGLFRQSVLKDAFEGKFKKSEESWIIAKVGDIFKTTSGGTPSRQNASYYKGEICWVKSGELNYNVIFDTSEKISQEAIDNSSAKIFPRGTLLIALYGATIGRLAFLGVEAATNQAICGIFDNKKDNLKYLFYFLLYHKPELIKIGTGGAQPNISQDVIRKIKFPLPTPENQAKTVEKIEELFSHADNLDMENQKYLKQAELLRGALLKAAFEGKLVTQNPNDEPAERLLERIKKAKKQSQAARVVQKKADRKLQKERKSTKEMDNTKGILTILEEHTDSRMLTAKEVWQVSKWHEDIEGFYAELKELIEEKHQVEDVKHGKESYLRLKTLVEV